MQDLETLRLRVCWMLEKAEHLVVLDRIVDAEAVFFEAIEIDPGFHARFAFAEYLADRERDSAALEQFQMLADAGRRGSNWKLCEAAVENMASIHRRTGRFATAASLQQQVIAARMRDLSERNRLLTESAPRRSSADGAFAGLCGGRSESIELRNSAVELLNSANDALTTGDICRAESILRRAMAIASREAGLLADIVGTLGVVRFLSAQHMDAVRLLHAAFKLHRRSGDRVGVASDCENLGEVFESVGRFASAIRYYQRAVRWLDPRIHAHATLRLDARIQAAQKRVAILGCGRISN